MECPLLKAYAHLVLDRRYICGANSMHIILMLCYRLCIFVSFGSNRNRTGKNRHALKKHDFQYWIIHEQHYWFWKVLLQSIWMGPSAKYFFTEIGPIVNSKNSLTPLSSERIKHDHLFGSMQRFTWQPHGLLPNSTLYSDVMFFTSW